MDDVSIYTNKDGRTRVYLKDSKKVISYPRYLMEKEIGRPLSPNEDIHHKDENPLNNDISNLEIRIHGEHQKDHATKYFDKIVTCAWCGKEFTWSGPRQQAYYANYRRKDRSHRPLAGPFCSNKCVGSYGTMIQNKDK